jgi:hypothetical protein
MAVSAYVDSVALNTTTGNQTVSPGSLSFTPTGAIFSGNRLTADGGQADANWFMGAAASSANERYQSFESEDASASADVGSVAEADGCMGGLLADNASDFKADFTAFNNSPNGISFNLSNAPAAASMLSYMLLGGDVTSIQTGVLNLGTVSGNKSVTGLSGTPACVLFFVTMAQTADITTPPTTGNAVGMVGWMCADGTQGVCGTRHTDTTAAGDTARWQRTDRCVDMRTVSANIVSAVFTSMDANGFTVNSTVTSTNIRTYYVAIYGGVWTAGSFDTNTGTGSFDVTTSGVNPKLLILQTFGNVANTATQTHGTRSIGASDGTRRWALAYDDRDAADPTVADSYLDRTKVLLKITAGTPTLDDAWSDILGTEKFTLNHTTASGVAIQGIYVVGGDAPTGASITATVGAAAFAGLAATLINDFRLTPTTA